MKKIFTKSIYTLMYPVLWCRQTLLDASRICGSYDFLRDSD